MRLSPNEDDRLILSNRHQSIQPFHKSHFSHFTRAKTSFEFRDLLFLSRLPGFGVGSKAQDKTHFCAASIVWLATLQTFLSRSKFPWQNLSGDDVPSTGYRVATGYPFLLQIKKTSPQGDCLIYLPRWFHDVDNVLVHMNYLRVLLSHTYVRLVYGSTTADKLANITAEGGLLYFWWTQK